MTRPTTKAADYVTYEEMRKRCIRKSRRRPTVRRLSFPSKNQAMDTDETVNLELGDVEDDDLVDSLCFWRLEDESPLSPADSRRVLLREGKILLKYPNQIRNMSVREAKRTRRGLSASTNACISALFVYNEYLSNIWLIDLCMTKRVPRVSDKVLYHEVASHRLYVPIDEREHCVIPFHTYDPTDFACNGRDYFDEGNKSIYYHSPCINMLCLRGKLNNAFCSPTEFYLALMNIFIREKMAMACNLDECMFVAVILEEITFFVNLQHNWLGIYHSTRVSGNDMSTNRLLFMAHFQYKDVNILA